MRDGEPRPSSERFVNRTFRISHQDDERLELAAQALDVTKSKAFSIAIDCLERQIGPDICEYLKKHEARFAALDDDRATEILLGRKRPADYIGGVVSEPTTAGFPKQVAAEGERLAKSSG